MACLSVMQPKAVKNVITRKEVRSGSENAYDMSEHAYQ